MQQAIAAAELNSTTPLCASCNSFYRPELDVLRFFAFLGVFLFHFSGGLDEYIARGAPRWIAWADSPIRAGVFGVDLFFALSTYLITELLLQEKENSAGSTCERFICAASYAFGLSIFSLSV